MATPIQQVILRIDNRDYILGIKQAEAETKAFGNQATVSFNQADAASNKLNLSAANLTGGLLRLKSTLGTIAFGAFATNALASADAIADLSDATSISIGKLLEFQKALQDSGGNANDLSKVINEFYQAIDQANQGSDKAIENFGKLGVSLNDLKTLSEADLLDKTIRGFENIKDPIERAAIAREKFGKAITTTDLARLSQELENNRGQFQDQQTSIQAAADSIQKFENILVALRLGFVQAVEPLLQWIGALDESGVKADTVSQRVRQLGVIIGTYFAASAVLSVVRGIQAITAAYRGMGLAAAFASGGVKAAAGIAAVGAAAVAIDKALGSPIGQDLGLVEPPTPNISAAAADRAAEERRRVAAGENAARDRERRNREQQIGKELQSQLNSVNQLMEGYRRATQANMDRYTLEVDILGRSQEEVDLIRGRAEIEKRYGDQIAALEDKKKGAKGQTLTLIQRSIQELQGMKTSELDIFEITKGQVNAYKQIEEQMKRNARQFAEESAQQDENRRAIIEFEDSYVRARVAAQEQFKDLQRNFEETQKRYQLEKDIRGQEKTTQDFRRSQFNLEQQRNKELRDLANNTKLSYADRVEQEKKVNEEYNRQVELERTRFAEIKYNQENFVYGWEEAFNQYVENSKNAAQQAQQYFQAFAQGFENAIVKFVMTGKLSFKDLANSIIAEFARIQAQKMFVSLFGQGGFFGNVVSSLFGMGKAGGGSVVGGRGYVVGEAGPELFIPSGQGQIVPNYALQGGGGMTTVNYNIQAIDAQSFRTMIARDPQFIYQVTEAGRRSTPTRRLA